MAEKTLKELSRDCKTESYIKDRIYNPWITPYYSEKSYRHLKIFLISDSEIKNSIPVNHHVFWKLEKIISKIVLMCNLPLRNLHYNWHHMMMLLLALKITECDNGQEVSYILYWLDLYARNGKPKRCFRGINTLNGDRQVTES